VDTGGVEAYSTLGWFKDPALNTFIFDSEPDLAELIFHELGHQRVFARGDTDFNEAFATTVGQEGARRWLQAKGDSALLQSYLAELQRTLDFVHLIARTRTRLQALYGDELDDDGKIRATRKKPVLTPDELRLGKQKIIADLRAEYAALKQNWGGSNDYEAWFAHEVNNAQLNSVAAYYDLVPSFEHLLATNGGDLAKFYAAAERLSKLDKKERHTELASPRSLPVPTSVHSPAPSFETTNGHE